MHRKISHAIARTLMMAVTLGLLAASFAPALAQTPEASPIASPVTQAPTFEESECMYDLPSGLTDGENVICGWVTAPMYPDGSKEGTVTLPIIRVLATTDTPEPDPLLILLGGPGQNMSAVLPLFGDEFPYWSYMLERQDVILFDQRGMGLATPSLACPFERESDGSAPESDIALGFALLRCGTDLVSDGIDPAAFTTQNNAADIEAIRVAMGYDQVNLYGVSYGSKLGLSAVRDYPVSIRSTIIASPLPLEQNPFADQILGFDHALKLVWDACAADDACTEANPNPAGDFERAIALLADNPMTMMATNPATGELMELEIDHYMFMTVLYLGVFVGDLVPLVPYLVTSVANGDDSVLQMFAPMMLADGGVSMGALFTYFCQDEAPFSPERATTAVTDRADLAAPISEGYFVGLAQQVYAICGIWQMPEADVIESEAVTSDEPMLIFTGTFDPITPASNGDAVAANFPNSQLVNFVSQGHDPATGVPECSGPMMMSFLDDPTAPVDASCADAPVDFSMPEPESTPVASPAAPITDSN